MANENDIVRRLYRGSVEWPLAYFQRAALDTVMELLPFDSAMWARGGEAPEAIVDVFLDRQPPQMIEEYMAGPQHMDFLADAVRSQPGRTVNLCDLMSRAEFEKTPIYQQFSFRWGVQQVLSTSWMEPQSGLLGVLSLWRKSPKKVFTEPDRLLVERLVPHLAEALRLCRIGYMRQAGRPAYANRQPMALCNPRGALIEVESGFVELLQREWPDWHGTTLPQALWPTLRSHGVQHGQAVVVSVTPLGDVLRVQARERSLFDALGKRQQEIAMCYARGESYREIAESLGLAESTVRNHVAAIFKKCRVSSKVELAAIVLQLPAAV